LGALWWITSGNGVIQSKRVDQLCEGGFYAIALEIESTSAGLNLKKYHQVHPNFMSRRLRVNAYRIFPETTTFLLKTRMGCR
jgi:hypothetical protein